MIGSVVLKGKRYHAVFDIGRDPVSGKRRQKWGPGFKIKREAECWKTNAVNQVNKGQYISPTKETVAQWCSEWLDSYCRLNLRENVMDDYRQTLERYFIPFLGSRPLSALTANDLDLLYAKMVSDGLSKTTVHHLHVIIHNLLKSAIKKGKLSHNVAEDADSPSPEKPNIEVWNPNELAYFFDFSKKYRPDLAPIYEVLGKTGGRIGEVEGCKWNDFTLDIDTPKWAVRRTVYKRNNGQWIINPPKTKKSKRSIDLQPSLVLLLRGLRERAEADAEYYGRNFNPDDYVFLRPDGKLHDPQYVSKVFQKIIKEANLKHIRLHDLRHTHATILLLAGVHPKIVSERLGHASVAITLDIYSHVLPGMQEEAVAKFELIMERARTKPSKERYLTYLTG